MKTAGTFGTRRGDRRPVAALPPFLTFTKVHLTNSYRAVLLPSIVSPFGVYLSQIFVGAAVPDELIGAGRLDGSGEFRIFFSISARLMAPALVTIFLLQSSRSGTTSSCRWSCLRIKVSIR